MGWILGDLLVSAFSFPNLPSLSFFLILLDMLKCFLHLFLTMLLRCNLYTIKFTYFILKCTIQWFFYEIYRHVHTSPQTCLNSSLLTVSSCFHPSPSECVCVCVHAKSLQSCPTLCNPMDCSPPGSSIHGDKKVKSRHITLLTKVCLVKAIIFPVVMYGHESWTIKKTEHRRTDVFELWCGRRLLRVPWTARRSNQSILKETNPEYSLEGLMLKLKLQYFGHWCEEMTHWKRPWCWKR